MSSSVDEHEPAQVLDGRVRSRFRRLRVKAVVSETADAVSLVLDVPAEQAALFAYRPGQYVTVRVEVDGEVHLRAYSMSSAPGIDPDLRITIKRVPGGVVSNWLNDHVVVGDSVELTPPAGRFVVPDGAGDLVAYAAGSGITPVLSIVTSVLAGSTRRVSLLYANRDRASTIFADRLDELAVQHDDRFRLAHHFDVDAGFVSPTAVARFARDAGGTDHFVCGPEGFMSTVEAALADVGVDPGRIYLERFTPADELPAEEVAGGGEPSRQGEVTLHLGGRKVTVPHRPGTTVLQSARFAGLRAPSSCESGSCATCMARVVEGEARMRNNEALTRGEVADGWVLTCQAEPVSSSVTVVYE
jgi:ferredoxin-NADP reductase